MRPKSSDNVFFFFLNNNDHSNKRMKKFKITGSELFFIQLRKSGIVPTNISPEKIITDDSSFRMTKVNKFFPRFNILFWCYILKLSFLNFFAI